MEPNQSFEPGELSGVASGHGPAGRGALAVDDADSVGRGGLAVDDAGPVGGGDLAVDDDLVIDDLLVEEISIDGMCGVY